LARNFPRTVAAWGGMFLGLDRHRRRKSLAACSRKVHVFDSICPFRPLGTPTPPAPRIPGPQPRPAGAGPHGRPGVWLCPGRVVRRAALAHRRRGGVRGRFLPCAAIGRNRQAAKDAKKKGFEQEVAMGAEISSADYPARPPAATNLSSESTTSPDGR
jgi:hypothetical protein